MARQSIPNTPSIRTLQYDNLLGVDYQNDATEISRYRSPDMVNMISDLGGNPVKRYGYRRIGNAYEGFAVVNGENYAVRTREGYSLNLEIDLVKIAIEDDGSITELEVTSVTKINDGTRGRITHVFGFRGYIYVICEKAWFECDVKTSSVNVLGLGQGIMYSSALTGALIMPETKFIPTVYTMYKPNGKELVTLPEGTDLTGATQGVNILTPFRRIEYCVTVDTATEAKFVIPNQTAISPTIKVEVLSPTSFEWTETSDYHMSASSGPHRAIAPDGSDAAFSASVKDAYIEFDTLPYSVTTDTQSVKHLVFAGTTTDVPAGVPNVRITYAPFNMGLVDKDVDPSQMVKLHPMSITATVEQSQYRDDEWDVSYYSSEGGLQITPDGLYRLKITLERQDVVNWYEVDLYGGVSGTSEVLDESLRIEHFRDHDYIIGLEDDYIECEVIEGYKYSATPYVMATAAPEGTTIKVTTSLLSSDNHLPKTVTQVISGTEQTAEGLFYYDGDDTFRFFNTIEDDVPADVIGMEIEYSSQGNPRCIGFYREDRVELMKSDAMTIYDAKLFSAYSARTYYSRSGLPLVMDDNFYFDVDNKIKLYAKTSSALAIIAEDTGKDVIYLAQGEYDSNLAMQVYTVRASNAGVGAISSKVSGVLNDEPIFLSRTGLYGITTNYYSEKYSIARSGKINRRMCAEPNLESAVGTSYNGYFYLAVNGHMYVLDSRHKDQSRNGDNSYESYYFEGMPNIIDIFVIGNRMFFSDGTHTYTWNDTVSALMYYDVADGVTKTPVKCRWTSMLDNDGVPNYYKVLNKKGTYVTLSPPMQTSCEVTIIKDAHDRIYAGRFDGSTFALSDSVLDGFTKKKIKKYKRLQFVVENNEAEPFGILSIVKSFTVGNLAKR